jgi:AcrR family transcriptional regulator
MIRNYVDTSQGKCEHGSHKWFRWRGFEVGIREERRAERQVAVLDAATEIIESEGMSAVTIAAVAERIGASVGGMYRYFPTKRAIFLGLQLQSIGLFEAFLDSILHESKDGDPLDRIIVAFEAWPQFRADHPTHYRLLDAFLSMTDRTLGDEEAGAVHSRLQSILGRIASTIDAAVNAGRLSAGDAMARTHLLWAALHGLGQFRKRDHLQPEGLKVDALRPQLYAAFLKAWSVQPLN